MKKRIYILLFMLMAAFAAGAQTVDQLEKQIRQAQEEIRRNEALLEKSRKDRSLSESQLKLIRSRITNRKDIISSLEKQITLINTDIETKSGSVSQLEKELSGVKKEYAEMVRAAYKNYKLNNFLVFLFASKDFNDVTRRVEFMRRYNRSREEKAARIDSLARNLTLEIDELDHKREELAKTRENRNAELSSLGKDEVQYNKSVQGFKANESKIQKTLRDKQNQIAKAQQQIQKIIAEEARKNKTVKRTAAEEEALVALSGRFDENRGKLPYPVRGGVVIDPWGKHGHPTLKGLTVDNKGVDIAAEKGAVVRCVFDGVVSHVGFLPGMSNVVMVRHGSYLTVYSKMASVSVKKGDNVTLNQTLGALSTSDDDDEHVLHFEVWRELENLNPSLWLRR